MRPRRLPRQLRPRPHPTQSEFTSDEDFLNRGNAPYPEVLTIVDTSLPEFWGRAFDEVFGRPFRPPAIEPFQGTAPDCAADERDLVFCPASDLVAYDEADLGRPAYELGDFAVLTAASIPYARRAGAAGSPRRGRRRPSLGGVPDRLVRRAGLRRDDFQRPDLTGRHRRRACSSCSPTASSPGAGGRRPDRLPVGRPVPRRILRGWTPATSGGERPQNSARVS